MTERTSQSPGPKPFASECTYFDLVKMNNN